MTNKTYRVGSIIQYIAYGGEHRLVRVTGVLDDIKNGSPGFDGVLVDDPEREVWGYEDQIRVVEKY